MNRRLVKKSATYGNRPTAAGLAAGLPFWLNLCLAPCLAICLAAFSGCNKESTPAEETLPARDVGNFFPSETPAPTPPPKDEGNTEPVGSVNKKAEFLEIVVTDTTMIKDSTQELRSLAVMPNKSKRYATLSTTWVSESPDVADFVSGENSPGTLTAKSAGQTRIVATLGDVSATAIITVTEASFSYLEISPTNIFVGTPQKFTARAIYSNGTSQALTSGITWSSNLPAMAAPATGHPPDTFLATAPGTFILSAHKDGFNGSAPIKVQLMELDQITIESSTTTVPLGTSVQLRAMGKFKSGATSDVTEALTWSSSNEGALAVSDIVGSRGQVTTNGAGSAMITASSGKVVGSMAMDVQTVQFTSLRIDNASIPVPKGLVKQLSAIGVKADATEIDITNDVVWDSSNPFLASISNDAATAGQITAFSPGTVTITALYGQAATQIDVAIIDATIVSLTVNGPEGAIDCGVETPQLTAVGMLSDGTESDITSLVTWTTSAAAVATVSNDPATRGIMTSKKAGSVVITAQYFVAALGVTVEGQLPLEIGAAKLIGYEIVAPQESFPVGTSQQLLAKGKYSCTVSSPEFFTSAATWSSTNPKVAVSNVVATKGFMTSPGVITVPETTIVRAVKGTMSGEIELEIRPKEVVSISLNATNDRVDIGATVNLLVTALYSDNSSADITAGLADHQLIYTTNYPGIATADGVTGVVTGVLEGYFQGQASLLTPRGVTLSGQFSMGTQSNCSTGMRRDLYCWFMGSLNQSCTDVCTLRGAVYRTATETFTGSGGSGANCAIVLGAFGFGNLNKDNQNAPGGTQGLGCGVLEAMGVETTRRYSNPLTTAEGAHPNVKRVCACNQ